jgi:hypothetical protein
MSQSAQVTSATRDDVRVARAFDYAAPAELFPSRNRKARRLMTYRRFETGAEAVRFAIEELPAVLFLGAFIEMDEERFDHNEIRRLYDSDDFPLPRAKTDRLNG